MTDTDAMCSPPDRQGLSPDSLALLVQGHARFLAFLQPRVGSREQAEEILQQAFVRAIEKGHSLEENESVTAWFYRSLRNALVDHYRRRASERRGLERAALEPPQSADDPELMQAVCACVLTLVDTLDPHYRALLRRVDVEGAKVVDVAREEGISANNAGVRLHRARRALLGQLALSCGTCATHGCLDCHCEQAPPAHGSAPSV